MKFPTFVVKGETFVIVPIAEFRKLAAGAGAKNTAGRGAKTAVPGSALAAKLKKARETAGLTQTQLAKKMKKSETLVSAAERGSKDVGERYVQAVLKACGLPTNWQAKK